MPVLKQLGPALPKKRIERGAISAPLGDFRHTMHVGRGGDAFGDTSFLSRHGGPPSPAPSNGRGPPQPPQPPPPPPRPGLPPPRSPAPAHPGPDPDPDPDPGPPPGDPAEPFLSFQLDLGPSILDEVLGVMERGERDRAGPGAPEGGGLRRGPRLGFGSEEELDDVIGL
ncbi:cdc42 effector protein 5 [Ornithorhynchus anatinus]|uniref:cdc42 effector protein 5 n=1 Tax=Ornithorhynchus anatinus TaxID=9258 RepID=UPI0010A7C050|nr:cdc42 effector protein 5 [Ornithorhynchus anatinus]XP_028929609.1 cdc42 effector protein 5 [Ornithorhynchus anatinus]XP_028929610.1 cdc42 effector protein 5 [Ornithorhynchus anatinus]